MTAEQAQLASAEKTWLSRHDPISRLRATLDAAPVSVDADAVTHAAESGLLALLTSDMGGSHADLAVATEAHGYAASSMPLADLVIGTWLLSIADLPQAAAASEGELLVGLAHGLIVSPRPGSWHLQGQSKPIPMASDMDRFVVVCEDADGEYAAMVDAVVVQPMATLDITRTWSRLSLDESSAEWVRLPAGTVSLVRDAVAVHRAIDSIGAASRLLEMTVNYARQREQFGAPIGSFQAVKHHCADMALSVEAGRSVCWAAAVALNGDPPDRSRAAAAACAYSKSAASRVAGTALQVHGGIGFTWEHDLHLFLRRIKVNEAFDGSVAMHRAALVAMHDPRMAAGHG
ncbi:MAG: acyl-CoA dehydrogenase family protein [Mycobacterium sp.]